jgi:hypothetical protein
MPGTDGPPAHMHVREIDARRRNVLGSTSVPLMFDDPVTVGREGDARIAVTPLDPGVSRTAVGVCFKATGFEISASNRQGAWLHLWGHHPARLEAGASGTYAWPRTAIRIVGHLRDIEHWVLLECDGFGPPSRPTGRTPDPVPGVTTIAEIPRALTVAQMAAVQLVFRQQLSWPPITGAAAVPLASAASRLRVTDTAVAERLSHVRNRARALGLHDAVSVTDPEYVYLLARHGYFPVPAPVGLSTHPLGSADVDPE